MITLGLYTYSTPMTDLNPKLNSKKGIIILTMNHVHLAQGLAVVTSTPLT